MSGLGEQIAVLDGLSALDPNDGRIGQTRARVTQYGKHVMPGVLSRRNVISPSIGANYSGGSSMSPGFPLMPSSVGLAGLSKSWMPQPGQPYFGSRPGFGSIPGTLPIRRHVIDYSGGANYSGGSSWGPKLPLLPSSAGLADSMIKGGYGRAGLGATMIDGGYGRAGLGQTNSATDEDLAAASEAVATARALDRSDGRIGQHSAQVDEYGRAVMPGVLSRSNVIDASEGANYSGGSSMARGLPLMPSSVGLAGLGGHDDLDGAPDKAIGLAKALKKVAGKNAVSAMKKRGKALAKKLAKMPPAQRARAAQEMNMLAEKLGRAREIRRQMAQNRYAVRAPLWAR